MKSFFLLILQASKKKELNYDNLCRTKTKGKNSEDLFCHMILIIFHLFGNEH